MIWNTLYAVTTRTITRDTNASRDIAAQASAAFQSAATEEQYDAAGRLSDDAYAAREFIDVREIQPIEVGTSDDHEGLFVRYSDGEAKQQTGLMQFHANDKRSLIRQLNAARGDRPWSIGTRNEVIRWFGTEAGAKKFLSDIA